MAHLKNSKVVKHNAETALLANDRAALRDDVAVKNLTTGYTVGEAEAGGRGEGHAALQADPLPEKG